MKKYILGLDIGITSVGWGIIEKDTGEIIDAGVRLFTEANTENNTNRRKFRHSRRTRRRKAFRISRLENLLKRHNILTKEYRVNMHNPYICRCKGLKEKLTKEELACALLHIAKLRGASLEVVEDDVNKEAGVAKETLRQNSRLILSGKFVCEVQLENLDKFGKVRGHQNIFRTNDYLKELDQILTNQEIPNETKNEIKKIISSRRHFSEGPGGRNSPTPYGRYLSLNQEEPIDLILKMRGKCSLFEDKYRAPINSYSYCLFNIYNDLNNLTIDGRKITTAEKDIVIQNYINKKGTITLKELSKICCVSEELISGYRIDKNGKAIFTEFKGYNTIRKLANKNIISSILIEDKSKIDKIIDILTETKIIEERIEKISQFTSEVDAIELSKISSISNYGYLSYEALHLFIEEMRNTNDNQMQISMRLNLSKKFDKHLKDKKNIPFNSENLTNPVVIRAQRETIKVINKIREKYGELESIVIELAREKNSKEEKENIKKIQAHNENINKTLCAYQQERKLNSKLKTKLRLAIDQNWKCAYSNQKIDLNTLLMDDTAYEIDHILPISLSFDDSYNNKVLVTHNENQEKGQRTPFEYFNSGLSKYMAFTTFTTNVLGNKNYNKKKIDNLLFKGNLLDSETQKKFINRNLQDTRYASRNILNELKKYYKVNSIDTKVFVVRGSITDQFRKKAKIKKNRDIYKHHAIDALIIATIRNNTYLISKLENESQKQKNNPNYIYKEDYILNETTGEIIESSFFDSETLYRVSKIKTFDKDDNFKFSWKVDKKSNRSVSDQTIFSTRKYGDNEVLIKKYKDIYSDKDATSILKLFKEGKSNKLLISKHDVKTYEIIKKIIENYPNETNPFAAFRKEHGEIRKYSKKGNGPIIKQLKYSDDNLGNHIDVSKNYCVNNKKVVLLQISPYRMDLYLDNGIYKFVTVRYSNIKHKNGKNVIDKQWYAKQKEIKKISPNAEFLFSFNKNDCIEIIQKNEKTMYKFIAVKNDSTNLIEVKLINQHTESRITPTIGKSIIKINKYNVDVLGNLFKIEKEELKLEF